MKRILSVSLIMLAAVSTQAQWKPDPNDVPAYNAAPPPKGQKLPRVLTPAQVAQQGFDHPAHAAAYRAAAKYPAVMHQLPCYCHCDRGHGHNSLHSCFEDTHGANCSTCMQEAILAAQMTDQGKTPKQIRAAIIAGDWQKIELRNIK
jgi:hypothetical protein